MIYHEGLLMADRLTNPALDKKATRLLADCEAGKIVLLQRRLAANVCQYLAIPKRRKNWWPGC